MANTVLTSSLSLGTDVYPHLPILHPHAVLTW